MRYPASEKLEIIWLVEQSHLPVKRTLEKLGIPRATFYRWCDLYQAGGPEALNDRSPRPDRVWNRIRYVHQDRARRRAQAASRNWDSRSASITFSTLLRALGLTADGRRNVAVPGARSRLGGRVQ